MADDVSAQAHPLLLAGLLLILALNVGAQFSS